MRGWVVPSCVGEWMRGWVDAWVGGYRRCLFEGCAKKKKKSGGSRIDDVVKGLVDLRILASRVECFKICDDGIDKVVGEPDNVVRICPVEKIEEVKRHS